MSTPAKVQEWLRNNNGNLSDAYKAVKYEGPPLKIKEGNLSNKRAKIRLSFRGENGDLARNNFDTTSTPIAHYESKQLSKTSSSLTREAKMFGLEGTRIEHLADQDDAKHMTAGAPGDPTNKAIVKASDAEFKNEVKRRLGKNYAVTLNAAEESVKAVPKKYYSSIADPNTLPGYNLRNLDDLAKLVARTSRKTMFGSVAGVLLGFLPEIDEITGGHINNGINSAMNGVKDQVQQSAEFYSNLWADRQSKGYDLHLF